MPSLDKAKKNVRAVISDRSSLCTYLNPNKLSLGSFNIGLSEHFRDGHTPFFLYLESDRMKIFVVTLFLKFTTKCYLFGGLYWVHLPLTKCSKFRSYFRTKCKYKFRTYFRKKCKFRSYFRKNSKFRSYFRKNVNFEHFVNGRWTQYKPPKR